MLEREILRGALFAAHTCFRLSYGDQWRGFSPSGFYVNAPAESYPRYSRLAAALGSFFVQEEAKSVLDLGAGNGQFIGVLSMLGIDVLGIDANPQLFRPRGRYAQKVKKLESPPSTVSDAKKLALSFVERQDLTAPLPYDRRWDWVLSMDTAEHIPMAREADYFLNMHKHNRYGVVISVASRREPGTGHVNCRDPSEVNDVFTALGYDQDHEAQEMLRKFTERVIFVFRRKRKSVFHEWRRDANYALSYSPEPLVPGSNLGLASQEYVNELAMRNMLQLLRTATCFNEAFTYRKCCEPEWRLPAEGNIPNKACFGNFSGFTEEECCNPLSKAMAKLGAFY